MKFGYQLAHIKIAFCTFFFSGEIMVHLEFMIRLR